MSSAVLYRASSRFFEDELADPFADDSDRSSDASVEGEGSDDSFPADAASDEVATRFALLADELAEATGVMSSTRRAMRHPAYIEILALGEPAIPLLVRRLSDAWSRPLWLRLLGSLTTFQPGANQETVPEAAAEWMRWAKRRGHRA